MAPELSEVVEAARRWPDGDSGIVEPLTTAWSWSHGVFRGRLDGDPVIVKVFADDRRNEHRREWDTLQALAVEELAPDPMYLSADDGPPVIVMSRVEGSPRPLPGLSGRQLEAFASAHRRVHAARPETSRPAIGSAAAALARTNAALASLTRTTADASAVRVRALRDARAWTTSIASARVTPWTEAEAYCRGDTNWGNYLWSGDQVVLVDFEDAGTNDPAVELADMVEHAANRGLPETTVDHLVDLWRLGHRRADVLEARRLMACFWLTLIEARERRGLPPRQVTADEQAERTLERLA